MNDNRCMLVPAGPLDVAMTELAPIASPKIAVEGVYFTIKLFPRDRHGNPATVSTKCCKVDIIKVTPTPTWREMHVGIVLCPMLMLYVPPFIWNKFFTLTSLHY